MSIAIERADLVADRNEVIAFLQANVNTRMRPEAYDWQYFSGLGETVFRVARSEGRIVCSQSFLPFPFRCGDTTFISAKSENSFLAPEHRGTPLFQDVYAAGVADCAAAGMPVVWGYTPAVKVWSTRLGFHVEPERMWQCIVPIGTPQRPALNAGPRAWASTMLTGMRAALTRSHAAREAAPHLRDANVTWHERPVGPDDINLLLEQLGGKGSLALDMSPDFLDWRVRKNPNVRYTGHFLYRNERLSGYVLVALKQPGPAITAQIADMAFTSEADAKLLVHRAVRTGVDAGCTWLRYFGNRAHPIGGAVLTALSRLPGARTVAETGMAFVVKHDETFPHADYGSWAMNGLWTEGYSA